MVGDYLRAAMYQSRAKSQTYSQPSSTGSTLGSILGGIAGLALAIPTGGLTTPLAVASAGLGASVGSSMGGALGSLIPESVTVPGQQQASTSTLDRYLNNSVSADLTSQMPGESIDDYRRRLRDLFSQREATDSSLFYGA